MSNEERSPSVQSGVKEHLADVVILGGGLGGVAAALAALKLGSSVILTEQTGWIGGQLTSQGVAPDEHPWVEESGCSASYRRFRDGVRRYYRRNYPVTPKNADLYERFNPGSAPVSRLAHEPRVAHAVLEAELAAYRASRQLLVLLGYQPALVERNGDRVCSVKIESVNKSDSMIVRGSIYLDATELGDVLELAGTESVVGAESQSSTGEPHALEGEAQPRDQQAITVSLAVDWAKGHENTIAKPLQYERWLNYRGNPWNGPQLSWQSFNLQTRKHRFKPLVAGEMSTAQGIDLWHYRRILHAGNFNDSWRGSDIVLVNWHQNDYWVEPLVGVSPESRATAIEDARQLSLSLLYWMQVEAPRHDSGYGYRELRLRNDVMGSEDGLAQYPYIRESRRLISEETILEQHISISERERFGKAHTFLDSVGIGYYNIDLHPSPASRTFLHVGCYPFQIPLGALLPVRTDNLIAACKNIGTTHITNGAYRMHHVEWGIGEAAGALAAYCIQRNISSPRAVRNHRSTLRDFQLLLAQHLNTPLEWPKHTALDRSLIAAAYWLPEGMAPEDGETSSFRPVWA